MFYNIYFITYIAINILAEKQNLQAVSDNLI